MRFMMFPPGQSCVKREAGGKPKPGYPRLPCLMQGMLETLGPYDFKTEEIQPLLSPSIGSLWG